MVYKTLEHHYTVENNDIFDIGRTTIHENQIYELTIILQGCKVHKYMRTRDRDHLPLLAAMLRWRSTL